MRPNIIDIDPATEDLIRYASNVTGGTWALTNTTPGDSLAHQVNLRNDSANDHSAKTAIFTGTDQNGNVLVETINMPAGSVSVETSGYFLTLISVVPSASIGIDTMDIGFVD